MAKKTAKKEKTPDFEGELEKLEEAVAKLEDGSLTLDEAIAQFEGGFKSWRHCQDLLEKARKKIEVLCEEAGIAGAALEETFAHLVRTSSTHVR